MAETYVIKDGETVDEIAFRHYGRHNGTTEAILDANRGLVAQPLALPEGLEIILPVLDDESPIQTVKLYD